MSLGLLESVAGVRVAGRPQGRPAVEIDPELLQWLEQGRRVIEAAVDAPRATYGVNTGFGHLGYVRVSPRLAAELQHNLIRSHAIGVGPTLTLEQSRAVLFLRLSSLARGYSGVRPEVVLQLAGMLNADRIPVIPAWGSVGASGDLVPLAHVALALVGEGEVWSSQGRRMPAAQALAEVGMAPLRLEAKEGLALVNGTEVTTAVGALALATLERLVITSDIACALTIEALGGSAEPFDARLLELRPHPQALAVAANVRALLQGSGRLRVPGDGPPQDAYSLRAVPAIHGSARSLFAWAAGIAVTEMNSVVDNPLVFPEAQVILSGANFHAQPVALAWDACRIGVATMANVIERRIDRLVNPHTSEGLPPFLTPRSGLRSGLMMAQYVAASLAADCRALAGPWSVHTIPTSAGQEDVVSMGTQAALAFEEAVRRLARLVALELVTAAQAAQYRDAPLSPAGAAVLEWVRALVPSVHDEDRALSGYVEQVSERVAAGEVIEQVRRASPALRLAGFVPVDGAGPGSGAGGPG
ncbi:MAG: histidine ammonia-lyase [Limnochordaceae bacterium]|nr:histidine ammonia-lyase [Limnochordaceae bacterium]